MHLHGGFAHRADSFSVAPQQSLRQVVVVIRIHENLARGAGIHDVLAHPVIQRHRIGAQADRAGVRSGDVGAATVDGIFCADLMEGN
jgi:hypothetical protein